MQNIYANHLTGDDRIDPRSEEGRKKHLDVEVTKVILADFPLTKEERGKLATDWAELEDLTLLIKDGIWVVWPTTAEIAVELWREGRGEAG